MYSKSMRSLRITTKEAEKVRHDINDDWHTKYSSRIGQKCVIDTHSNRPDSPSYEYHFINYDFNEYTFVAKYPTRDGR